MSTSIQLFSHLKNTDLACLSAEDAIQNLLGCHMLTQLQRYQLWEITLSDSQEQAFKSLQTILDNTYYLVNPNKESYILSHLPEKKINPGHQLLRVEILRPDTYQQPALAAKITRKTKISIESITQSILWEMIVKSDADLKTLQKQLEEQIVASTSLKQGILMNPIFEQFKWFYN